MKLSLVLITFTAFQLVHGGVIYREIFPSGPDAKASGWNYQVSEKAWDGSADACWSEAPGAGSDPAVNSKPSTIDSSWKGSVYIPGSNSYLFWTSEYTVTDPVTSIAWYMKLSNAVDKVYVAIKVNDGWYISEKGFGQSDASPETKGPNMELVMADAKWRPLTFETPQTPAGGNLSCDLTAPAISLPVGSIKAFGIYCPKRTDTQALDTFTIRSSAPDAAASIAIPQLVDPITGTLDPKLKVKIQLDDLSHAPFGQVVIGGGGLLTGIYPSRTTSGLAYLTCDMVGPWRRKAMEEPWQLLPVKSGFEPVPGFGSSGLAIDPKNANVVYADLGDGQKGSPMGVFKSIDGGISWKSTLQKFSASNQDGMAGSGGGRMWGPSLAIDRNATNVVYWATRKDGLWRTLDGGTHWKQVLNLPGQACRNVVIASAGKAHSRSKNIYVGVLNLGIYHSRDAGKTFQPDTDFTKVAGESPTIRWLKAADDGVVYAAVNRQIVCRNSKGWKDITPQEGEGDFASVAVDPSNSRRILAMRATSSGGLLFRSSNGGETWTQPNKIVTEGLSGWMNADGFSPMMGPNMLEIDPFSPKSCYITDAFELWHTKDAWADEVTFSPQTSGDESIVTLTLAAAPAVEGEDNAPLFSGVSDIRGFRHSDIFTAPKQSYIMAKGDWSSYVTSIDFCEADPNFCYAVKSFESNGFAKILRSVDNGCTWVEVTNPYPNEAHSGGKILVSANEPGRAVYLPANKKLPVYTDDGGQTWKPCMIANSDKRLPYFLNRNTGYTFALSGSSDKTDGKSFYAYSSEEGAVPGQVWTSRDGGATWTPSESALPSANPYDSESPVHLAVVPGRAGDVWLALGGGGLWHSTDFCKSFKRDTFFPGSRPLAVSAGAPDPRNPDSRPTIYVYGMQKDGLNRALSRSTNDGESWVTLPQVGYDRIRGTIFVADRQTYGRVYLGTGGLGIWYVQTDHLDHGVTVTK